MRITNSFHVIIFLNEIKIGQKILNFVIILQNQSILQEVVRDFLIKRKEEFFEVEFRERNLNFTPRKNFGMYTSLKEKKNACIF